MTDTPMTAGPAPADFNDVLIAAGPDAVRRQVDAAQRPAGALRASADALAWAAGVAAPGGAAEPPADAPWPDPILPGTSHTPEIPAQLLPSWLADMAAAVARSTQTPEAMSVLVGLGVLATALQRRYVVAPYGDDYQETLSLFLVVLMVSGTRKTAVLNAMCRPLDRHEKLLRDRARVHIARSNSAREVARKRIERLTAEAAKAKEDSERERLRAEIQHEEEAMPEELFMPRVYTGNCNAERMQGLLVENGGRAAVISDEADVLAVMGGLYNGGNAVLDVYLQGFSGSPLRVDRVNRSAYVERPAITFCLAIQPASLVDLTAPKRFRDSGLLPRFLFALPESNVGRRDVRRHEPIPEAVANTYEARMLALMDEGPGDVNGPKVLGLTEAARELWLDFAEYIEQGQGPGGRFEAVVDWTSKLPGAVARISALIELAESGQKAEDVNEDSMRSAVALGELLIAHAMATFGLIGRDSVDVDARAVLDWVRAQQRHEFRQSDLQRAMSGRFATLDRLKKAMARLQENHVVQGQMRANKGARPSTVYVVNPKAFS
jgi:putative DNA primase/helicase